MTCCLVRTKTSSEPVHRPQAAAHAMGELGDDSEVLLLLRTSGVLARAARLGILALAEWSKEST